MERLPQSNHHQFSNKTNWNNELLESNTECGKKSGQEYFCGAAPSVECIGLHLPLGEIKSDTAREVVRGRGAGGFRAILKHCLFTR